ncbi:MAG: 5-oxoprolinase subunit PxpA [Acidobacteriota bacterium]
MTFSVDLNSDLGEGVAATLEDAILACVTSANVACGVHAGSLETMRATVRRAVRRGVAVGAHPGLADPAGMGRHEQALAPGTARELVLDQVRALARIAAEEGARLAHVKPHGALYTMVARDRTPADEVASAVHEVSPALILVGPAGSALEAAAADAGVPFAAEVFADRGVRRDGSLVPRSEPGAFVTDAAVAAARVVEMVVGGRVRAVTGEWLAVRADTVCVHGDTPHALALTAAVRAALAGAGAEVMAMAGVLHR